MTLQKLVDKGKIVLTQGPGLEGQISWAGFCLRALEYIFLGFFSGGGKYFGCGNYPYS